jgi:DNA-binding Lrp family transcriptional regulator
MSNRLDEVDKRIISSISCGIPVSKSPYKELATSIGITEAEFVERLKRLKDDGIIRAFKIGIDYMQLGYTHNAMVAISCKKERIADIASEISEFCEVSHCYERLPKEGFPYNLFVMIHGKRRDEIVSIVKKIERLNSDGYALLFTEKEHKKSKPKFHW